MKSLVIGVKKVSGKSKRTGSNYAMCRLLLASEIRPTVREDFQVAGYGFEVSEVEIDEGAIAEFASVKFPMVLELKTDMRVFSGKLVPVVVGILKAAA